MIAHVLSGHGTYKKSTEAVGILLMGNKLAMWIFRIEKFHFIETYR